MSAAWYRLVTRSTRDDRRLARVLLFSVAYLTGYLVLRQMQ